MKGRFYLSAIFFNKRGSINLSLGIGYFRPVNHRTCFTGEIYASTTTNLKDWKYLMGDNPTLAIIQGNLFGKP